MLGHCAGRILGTNDFDYGAEATSLLDLVGIFACGDQIFGSAHMQYSIMLSSVHVF